VIFLTTGTQLPFDRLVRAVDGWAGATMPGCEIFAQVLPASQDPYTPRNFDTRERLFPKEYAEVFDKAQLIISHAGMGTILTALTRGKQICIMPRQVKYREHRNDHQLATVERLKDYPGLFKARDEHDLPTRLDAAMGTINSSRPKAIDLFADTGFTDSLRNFILTGRR
jgi:predicted glycosyltransferase